MPDLRKYLPPTWVGLTVCRRKSILSLRSKMIETLKQEKRRQGRFIKRCEIEFASGGQIYRGISSNFSLTGLFVRTRNPFAPGTIITMIVHLPDGSTSRLSGRVIRALKTSHGSGIGTSAFLKEGMGIEITEKDSRYLKFISLFAASTESRENSLAV